MPTFVRITAVALARAGVGATTAACAVEDPAATATAAPSAQAEQPSIKVNGPSDREARQAARDEAKAKAAAKVKSGKIAMGMTPAQVKRIVGAPEDTDSMSSEFMGETTTISNWTWTSDILSDRDYIMVSLGFTDGRLDSKSVM